MHTKPNNYGTILLVILIVILISILLINKGIYSEDKTGKVISEDIYSPDLKANQFSYLAASYDYYNPAIPENTSLYDGYIIEFEDDPVIVEQGKLANKAKENADKIEDNSEFIKNIRGAFLLMPEDVEGKVEEYSLNIKDNNEGTKARILSELGESEESSGISGNAIQNRINTNSEVNLVFNGIAMDITDEEAKKIKNVKGVKKVYPNYKVNITLMDSVPMIGADDVWKLDANGNNCSISGEECLTGKGVTIGIIDTGVDYTHPDLGGCFGEGCKVIGGYDFVNNDVDPMDDNGHGTHVAATAAGKGILKGVAPDAKLYAFKVLNSEGSGEAYDIIQAITRTIDLDNDGIPMENENDYLDIVSLSLGGPGNPDDPMSLAIDSIVDAGVVAVIAAGNSGPEYSTIGSPGTSRKAITVGAVDKTNQIAYFSSRGPVIWTGTDGKDKSLIKPDVTAPGVNICAAEWASAWSDRRCLDNKHIAISGTSMATPHVAGVVALLKQKHPDWTPAEIKNSLKYSAKANIAYGSNVQGYGLVDVLNLINLNKSIPVVWDFGITSPLEPLMETNKSIEIKGIFPENYESLKVRYHNELNSIWSSAGITIVGINSTIAIISPLVSSNGGKYIFEIEIKKDGIIKTETISYSFDSSLMKGNPIKINSQAWMDFPILEDLNNDSVEELIFSTMPEGLIYVINSNLENLPGWPKQIGSFGADTPPGGSPSVADLDNDGVKDIVLVSGYSAAGRPGYLVKSYVYAFHLNGDSFRGFPVAIELSDPLHLPTIYDINNDGKPEIIVTTGAVAANTLTNEWYENRKIYVINNKGEFLTNWPVETTNTLKPLNGASIIDLDNDGKSEIIVGTINYSASNFNKLGEMESFYFNGSMVRGFPKQLGTVYSITSEDLNDDGFTEIIINSVQNGASILSVFSYINGSFKEYCTNHQYSENVVIGDINKDSKSEIISLNGNSLSVLNYTCGLLPGWPKSATGYVYRQPIIANIDGDANEEILVVGQDGGVFAFNFKGETVAGFPKYVSGQGRDLTVGNFDSDAFIELIVTSKVDEGGNIYVFNLNASYNKSLMAWPKYRHDSQRTNCYDCNELDYGYCGNGMREGTEQCDGNNLGGATCESVMGTGYTGTLKCSSSCIFENSLCIPPLDIRTGLVASWKLDGNASDSIGTNHGTVNGATLTNTSCKSGKCYLFDGVNDYLSASSSQFSRLIGKPYTISVWVNENTSVAQLNSLYHRIISFANGTLNIQLGLASSGGTPNNRIFYIQESKSGSVRQVTSGNASIGWHHVVATSNGAGNWNIYLDGVLSNGGTTISGSSSVYTTNTGKLYIGQRGNGGYTNGKLDEVMIWNRSLSPTEVLELYNSYQGCTPNCAGKQCGNNGCGGSCGTCPTGQICSGAGVCSTTCTNDCPSTTSRQCSGSQYQTCGDSDGDGCREWGSPMSCPSGQSCSGAGVCSTTCQNACTLNAKQCSGTGYQTCVTDSSGCTVWGSTTTCADTNPCTNDACSDGTCTHAVINCNDGNACTTDVCSGSSCTHTPITCDDGNSCTADSCSNGACTYTIITSCINNDRCCPSGCTSANDNDCQSAVSCNNNGNCDIYIGETCANCVADCGCSSGYICNSTGQCVTSTPAWQTGMISWWKLDGNALDSIGTNHGTVNGATLTSTGCKSGQCYSFDGINDYLNAPSSQFLPLIGKPYTISAWVNENTPVATLDITYHRLISFANGTLNIQLGLASSGGTPHNRIFYIQESKSGSVRQVTSGNASIGWHYVVATSDGAGNWNIYLDGKLSNGGTTISGSSSVYTTNTGKLYIGQRGNGGYTNGKLDEVMIWNRSLSSTEILELYNSYN